MVAHFYETIAHIFSLLPENNQLCIKYRASEYKAKLAWALLSAADIQRS